MLRFYFVIVIFGFVCCKNATDIPEMPKGQINGKVYNWTTGLPISRPASLTLSKRDLKGYSYHPLESTSSDSLGRYLFVGLNYGDYSVQTNIDNYYKTASMMFVTISDSAPVQTLDLIIDTVGKTFEP